MRARPRSLIPSILLVSALAACGQGSQENAAADAGRQGPLVAVANMLHPPFSSWDEDGNAVGIEVELVAAAAESLGRTVEWVERPFGELLTAVQSGEADVAASTIGITEARRELVALSDPYFTTQVVALVRDHEGRYESLGELGMLVIGADQGTTAYPAARAQWPEATLVGQRTEGMTWGQMIEAGLIDAHVVDASDQERLASVDGIHLYRIEESISEEHFGIAVAIGATDLLAALNTAIADAGRAER